MKKILLLGLIFSSIILRIDIFVNLPVSHGNLLFNMFLSFMNAILIYCVAKKYLDFWGSIISVFAYTSSPLIAYYEFSSSIYLPILTCLLISAWIFLKKKLTLFLITTFIFVLILIKISGITFYSDPGVINGLNQLRGESFQNGFGLVSKVIENKYIYLSLHFLFNLIEQFSPAVYFSPEVKILGFSFSPPILFPFMILAIIGLVNLIKKPRILPIIFLLFTILVLPSALSKDSPDLERLIIALPAISILSGYGFTKIKKLKYIIFILICFQLAVILIDISLREPVRLLLLRS